MTRFQMTVAAHLFLRQEDQILLSRRYNTGYEDGRYSVPAGHVDGGETIRQAMQREAWEECGIAIDEADLRVVVVMHRHSDGERIDFFVEAQRWSGEVVNRETDKCDDLRWVALDALPDTLIPYVRYAVHAYQDGTGYTEFGWDR